MYPLFEQVKALYDHCRFVDAYELTRDMWAEPDTVLSLSAPEVVLATRLAGSLGNGKFQRALSRFALATFPNDPIVRVYCRNDARLNTTVYELLRDFEANPDSGADDPEVQADWLGINAHLWGIVRGFDRARELLHKASRLGESDVYLTVTRGFVELMADNLEEALACAERAWDMEEPGGHVAALIGQVLTRRGRLSDAVEQLSAQAATTQSHNLLKCALWYTIAYAEREHDNRQTALATVKGLVDRLPSLTPLPDRAARNQELAFRLDVATLERDTDTMRSAAEALNSPYHRTVADALHANPDGGLIVAGFRPLWQRYNECLPTSIACVLNGTVDITEDDIAHDLTYGGTTQWQTMAWLRQRGVTVKPFLFTPDIARELLSADTAFVYLTEGDNWAHAMAAVGYDEATGELHVHDPSQPRRLHILMDKIAEYDGPFSPEALALVPDAESSRLDVIPDDAVRPVEMWYDYWCALGDAGLSKAGETADKLRVEFPDHPLSRRLHGIHLTNTGALAEALAIQEKLLQDYPASTQCRRDLLASLHRTRDSARVLDVLRGLVEMRRLPGLTDKPAYPAATHLVQFADHLSQSIDDCDQAEHYLSKALAHDPTCAEAYHVLGDLLARQGRHAESVLPFRLGSLLAMQNDHYARSTCDAIARARNPRHGIEFLRERVTQVGESTRTSGAWQVLIQALEDHGYPSEAIETMEEAAERYAGESGFQAFAVAFELRMGRIDRAETWLERLSQSGHEAWYRQAATDFHYQRGNWVEALGHAEARVALDSQDIDAFRAYCQLYANRHGLQASLDMAREAVDSHRNDEAFEEHYLELLGRANRPREQEAVLRQRIARNPRDGWAWNQLCHLLLDKLNVAAREDRPSLIAEVETCLQTCQRIEAGSPRLLALMARLADARGNTRDVFDMLFACLELEPSYAEAYSRILHACDKAMPEQRDDVIRRLEESLFSMQGQLSHSWALASALARRSGVRVAEEHVASWRRQRPDDPELTWTQAQLWLAYGHGKQDARRACESLEEEIRRFPNHYGLRLLLADAYALLQREDDEIAAYREILQRCPRESTARQQLSRVHALNGAIDEAEELLKQGIEIAPLAASAWHQYADLLQNTGRFEDMLDVLQRGVERMPEDISLRGRLIDVLLAAGMGDVAVRHARELVDIYPDGAYCLYLLGNALRQTSLADMQQVERVFRQALSHNARLPDAIEGLVRVMVSQHRNQEAHSLLDALPDDVRQDSDMRLLKARLHRIDGDKEEARGLVSALVGEQPGNVDGWWTLMDWLTQDEAWDDALRVLDEWPAVLHTNVELRVRRLDLLHDAGRPLRDLDAEWEELMRNFPEHETLNLVRFDALGADERWDEAGQLLVAYERFADDAPRFLARKTQLHIVRDELDSAVETAVRLCAAPPDGDEWPDDFVWDVVDEANLSVRLARGLVEALQQGKRVRGRSLIRAMRFFHATRDLFRIGFLRSLRYGLQNIPVSVRAHFELLDLLNTVAWDADLHINQVLEHLSDAGMAKQALGYSLTHRELYRGMPTVWQTVAMLMNNSGVRSSQVVEWMSNWREQPGLQMWGGTNYLMALTAKTSGVPRRDLPKLQHEAARDMLGSLSHDYTARYVATLYCEAALYLGQTDEFRDALQHYRTLLQDTDEGLWMHRDKIPTPWALLVLEQLLDARDEAETWRISREFANYVHRADFPFRSWWRLTEGKLSTPRRLLLALRVLVFNSRSRTVAKARSHELPGPT